jgi:hypothetical protein
VSGWAWFGDLVWEFFFCDVREYDGFVVVVVGGLVQQVWRVISSVAGGAKVEMCCGDFCVMSSAD